MVNAVTGRDACAAALLAIKRAAGWPDDRQVPFDTTHPDARASAALVHPTMGNSYASNREASPWI